MFTIFTTMEVFLYAKYIFHKFRNFNKNNLPSNALAECFKTQNISQSKIIPFDIKGTISRVNGIIVLRFVVLKRSENDTFLCICRANVFLLIFSSHLRLPRGHLIECHSICTKRCDFCCYFLSSTVIFIYFF